MKNFYRPSELKIVDRSDGNFAIVGDTSEYELDVYLEFNTINSDLTSQHAREIAQYLIDYYNHNYK